MSYRHDTIGLNKNMFRWTPEQIAYLKEVAHGNLTYFGYAEESGNPTGFFDLSAFEKTEENQPFGYRSLNERAMEFTLSN